ncbi:spt20, partial [Acrasis kona]
MLHNDSYQQESQIIQEPPKPVYKDMTPIPNYMEHLQVSLIIKLYATHFTIEVNESAEPPVTLMYNFDTRNFLKEISECYLRPDLLAELASFVNLKFYEGSMVVQVKDHQYSQTPSIQTTFNTKPKKPKKKRAKSPPTSPGGSTILEDEDTNAGNDAALLDATLVEDESTGEKLFMKYQSDALFGDLNRFIDHYFPELDRECSSLTEQEQTILRTNVLQQVTHAIHSNICLDPSPQVLMQNNLSHYNANHTIRRRKRHPQALISNPSLTIPLGSNILPMLQSARKQEQQLLTFLTSSGWRLSPTCISSRNKQQAKKQKPTTKQKRNFSTNFPRNNSVEATSSPIQFLRKTETLPVNNKPSARARLLKFQATNDKSKIWKIEILPNDATGKRYSAIISPANEQPSSCVIGGKHATDLYIRRLKDMFTSNGKTRCILDQEVDYTQYLNYSQQQAMQASNGANGAARSVNPGSGVVSNQPTAPGGQAPPTPSTPAQPAVSGGQPNVPPNIKLPRPGQNSNQITPGNNLGSRIVVMPSNSKNAINQPGVGRGANMVRPGQPVNNSIRRPPNASAPGVNGQPATPGASYITPGVMPAQFNPGNSGLKQLTNISGMQLMQRTANGGATVGQNPGQPQLQQFSTFTPSIVPMYYNMVPGRVGTQPGQVPTMLYNYMRPGQE